MTLIVQLNEEDAGGQILQIVCQPASAQLRGFLLMNQCPLGCR